MSRASTDAGCRRSRASAVAMTAARWAAVVVGLCLLSGVGAADAPGPAAGCPEAREWCGPRGNRSLDARSSLKGTITTPQSAWKVPVGVHATRLVLEPQAGQRTVTVPPAVAPGPAIDAAAAPWGLSPPLARIGAGDRPLERTRNVTYAEVLPDCPGLERLEFESGFDKPTLNGQWQACVGHCSAWRDGAWQTVWQTEPIEGLFQALPVVADVDADGALEVALLPWCELLVLNARTGAIEDRCRFTAGRSYGFLGCYDLDGDGRLEFVVQADFAKHIDVLGYRDGRLALLWQREIELDISDPQRILRVLPDPVADVDGDGRLEVLANLYNETGDQRWHVLVFEGLTGTVEADLPNEFLQGLADLDGDGVAELLLTPTAGQGIPRHGPILVRRLAGSAAGVIWQRDDAGWATWDRPLPPHVNSAATLGQREVLWRRTAAGTVVVVLCTEAEGQPELSALSVAAWAQGRFEVRSRLAGPALAPLALDPEGRLLARCATAPGTKADIALDGAAVTAADSAAAGVPPSAPVLAWGRGEDRATVVVQSSGEELVAIQPPVGGQPAFERWRVPGRAQGDDWPNVAGALLADLAGGQRHIVHASTAPSGCARIVARHLDGKEAWHHDFPRIPGEPPVWNVGGAILWQAGYFTDSARQDVLVTVRRSMMHSEETYLLAGTDGHEVWHRDRQVSHRGVGGTHFAIADYNRDGRDDAASLHPSILYLLDGPTGKDLLARDTTWEAVPAKPVYWGLPVAGEFLGPGQGPCLFFATARRSMTGLIGADGSLAWSDALDHSGTGYPAFADTDGDGRTEAIAVGYDDGVRCYDASTGTVEWRLVVPGLTAPSGSASADLDSDGREEALFTQGATLYCLGTDAATPEGKVRWALQLPAAVGPPAVGAVDSSGAAAIVLVGADGCVYGVR